MPVMSLIFYGKVSNPNARNILSLIRAIVSKDGPELFKTIPSFVKRLRQLNNKPAAAILFVEDTNELRKLITFEDLLTDLPIILILSDRNEDSIALGHSLYPRILTYADVDHSEFTEVVKKFIAHYAADRNII